MCFSQSEGELIAAVSDTGFLFEEAPCGFIVFHPEGKILKVNKTFSKWIGKTAEEIYATKFGDLLSKSTRLYFQMVIYPLLAYQDMINEVAIDFNSAYGNFDALFNGIAYKNDKGEVIAINATIQVNKDRQKYKSELFLSKHKVEEERQKFEFLSDAIPGFVWTALAGGDINFVNQKIRDYFNIGSAAEYNSFLTVMEEDREGTLRAWKRCMETGKHFDKEVRLQPPGKTPEWFLLRAEPYYDQAGQIKLWVGSAISIHKKKLLQLANYSSLSESLTHAQQTLDHNKKMFLNIAMDQSHMIRKPLANILGLIELLKSEPSPEENAQLLDLLVQSSEELDALIKKVVTQTQDANE